MINITFTLQPRFKEMPLEFYPEPASYLIPDWYKNMVGNYAKTKDPSDINRLQTIKRCMPVFDAITSGYLLKTYTDIYIDTTDGKMDFKWAHPNLSDVVVFHPGYQTEGYLEKSQPMGAPKLANPWCIKTDKNYSVLIIPPVHRNNVFEILEGVVDTDKYNDAIQFPFNVKDNIKETIPAGTPIAQIIPFKRDEFKMQIGTSIEKGAQDAWNVRSRFINSYRNYFRTKKVYL
jgi:hypothetical protein